MLQSAGFKCDFDASLLVEETPVPASAELEEGEWVNERVGFYTKGIFIFLLRIWFFQEY